LPVEKFSTSKALTGLAMKNFYRGEFPFPTGELGGRFEKYPPPKRGTTKKNN
jgi:hypothetical protein